MELYIIEISKYIITLFMALYTYECFAVFRYDNEAGRGGIYIRQNLLMFGIHFTCYLSICLQSGKLEYIFFFAFQQVALFTAIVLYRILYPKANRLLMNNMCMFLAVSFVILTRLSYEKAVRQFLIVAVSLALSLAVPYLVQKLKYVKNLTWVYALTGIAALLLVLVRGTVTNGSRLSFAIAGISFQPSEFVKIIFVLCIAGLLYESEKFTNILLSALIAGIHVVILVLSRDLGSALIYFVAYVVMLYVASGKWHYLLAGLVSGSAGSVLAYYLFRHVRVRVQAWRDPWSVIDTAGYQITQSLFAIGGGNWFGLGLYQGSPGSIPYVETDFIFSAISEELGLLFALGLILVCLSCFIMFMNIAVKLRNKFYRLLAAGLGCTYIFQIFLTIGGGTKFIPLTGVTLPLVSYGGSSVLATIWMFTLIEGLYLLRQKEGQEDEASTKQQEN